MSTINNTTLLATTSTVASLDVLAASAALAGVHVDRADLLTQAGTLTASSALPAGSYDSVVVQSDAAISDAASWLGALGRCLKPTGTLIISGAHQATATKPAYETGATASISLKKPAKAAWKLDDTDELIDEDDLLTEEDRVRPAPVADDCDVGASGRKACKNCSCGRAEAEAQGVKLTKEMLDNPQSSCGNGLPPFEAGKKIQLGADLLAADV